MEERRPIAASRKKSACLLGFFDRIKREAMEFANFSRLNRKIFCDTIREIKKEGDC